MLEESKQWDKVLHNEKCKMTLVIGNTNCLFNELQQQKKFCWNLPEWGLPQWVELGERGGKGSKNSFRAAFSVTYLD